LNSSRGPAEKASWGSKPTATILNKAFLKEHHVQAFGCDTIRMAAAGGIEPFNVDQMMELDMEVHHHDQSVPVNALSTTADSLPGLGIVAAVLGVVTTMGALGGPPEEIGHNVAAALVGTFLGILLCYGFIGPISANMAKTTEEHAFYHVLRWESKLLPQVNPVTDNSDD
jgi:chemotaxis protein MotA